MASEWTLGVVAKHRDTGERGIFVRTPYNAEFVLGIIELAEDGDIYGEWTDDNRFYGWFVPDRRYFEVERLLGRFWVRGE